MKEHNEHPEIIQQWQFREPPFEEIKSKTTLFSYEYVNIMIKKPIPCCDNQSLLNLKSPSWTSLGYCRNCKKIIFTVYTDRMAGTDTDLVEIRTINGNSN